MFTTKSKEEVLVLKKQRLDELAQILTLHERQVMTADQRMQNQTLKERLAFRLSELIVRCKIEEADIKIDIYEQMLKALTTKS